MSVFLFILYEFIKKTDIEKVLQSRCRNKERMSVFDNILRYVNR